MSEGILLPAVARGTLLKVEERLARLRSAGPQILSILEGERDPIALQSTLACLLFEALPQLSFCGFYRRVDVSTLKVGPYQGPMGCLSIDINRGVCGACARSGQAQRIPDVHAFPGHIACDAGARSELVLPIFGVEPRTLILEGSDGLDDRQVEAVLDLDSQSLDAFSAAEADALAALLARIFDAKIEWPAWR